MGMVVHHWHLFYSINNKIRAFLLHSLSLHLSTLMINPSKKHNLPLLLKIPFLPPPVSAPFEEFITSMVEYNRGFCSGNHN